MYTWSLMGLICNKAHSNSRIHKPNNMQRKCKKEGIEQWEKNQQQKVSLKNYKKNFMA